MGGLLYVVRGGLIEVVDLFVAYALLNIYEALQLKVTSRLQALARREATGKAKFLGSSVSDCQASDLCSTPPNISNIQRKLSLNPLKPRSISNLNSSIDRQYHFC